MPLGRAARAGALLGMTVSSLPHGTTCVRLQGLAEILVNFIADGILSYVQVVESYI